MRRSVLFLRALLLAHVACDDGSDRAEIKALRPLRALPGRSKYLLSAIHESTRHPAIDCSRLHLVVRAIAGRQCDCAIELVDWNNVLPIRTPPA